MTLGGLALAVGILVDDATVEIENTHRNIAMRKPLVRAVLDGASQIAVPTFVATISICIVFVPGHLAHRNGALFVYAARHGRGFRHARVLPVVAHSRPDDDGVSSGIRAGRLSGRRRWRANGRTRTDLERPSSVQSLFEKLRYRYIGLLDWSLAHPGRVLAAFMGVSIASLGLVMLIGEDFFPAVDAGQMRLHARGPAGMRIEETELKFAALEREIRAVIPPDQLDMLIDNIGIPNSWPAIAQGDIPTISSADGEILISLNKENHAPTKGLRSAAAQAAARQVSRYDVLLPAGRHHQPDRELRSARAYRSAGGGQQRFGQLQDRSDAREEDRAHPRRGRRSRASGGRRSRRFNLNVDRVKASQMGLTQRDVTSSMLISLSGSSTVAPNFWMNWTNGVNYNIGVQTPQYRIDSLDALLRTPISVATEHRERRDRGVNVGRVRRREFVRRCVAERIVAGLRKSRRGRRQHAASFQSGHGSKGLRAGDREPLQRAAGFRCLRQCGPARSGWRGRGRAKDHAG